jgi:hypothetical protein
MKNIKSCLTTCGKEIRIYDVHFQYPDDRFVTYWVAELHLDNYYDESQNGFLIDGKRLCFRSARNVFYDIDMLTNGLDWLQDLRDRAKIEKINTYSDRLISIDRLRSLVNDYACSNPHIHGPGAPLLPEYDFVDFVEKTLKDNPEYY